jgi:UDP-glucose 4-epimerase
LAGNTSHSKSFEEPLKDVDSNAKSTLFMLEKIRELDLKCKFLLGSTFIVIGKPKKLPIDENTPCNPTTIYGTNRLASEYFCKIYHDVYGLDTNIFRITNSYGPREQVIPKKNAINFLIYQAFKKQEISIYNKGKIFRDFIYVDDVISGINTILEKGKPGELYWISSGKRTWFYEFGNILEKTTGCKVKYSETPTYTKKVDVGNFVVNNSKLCKLGWTPKISIDVGIKKTLTFFQSN